MNKANKECIRLGDDSSLSRSGKVLEFADSVLVGWCIAGVILAMLSATVSTAFSHGLVVCFAALTLLVYWTIRVGLLRIKNYGAFLFMTSICLSVSVVVLFNGPQISDFYSQIEYARDFLRGNPLAFHVPFFEDWPDLLGYTLVETLLLCICDKVMFIKLFEAACTSAIVVVAYSCMRLLSREPFARIASLCLVLFPMFNVINCTANNQILSALLALLSVRVYMSIRAGLSSNSVIFRLLTCGILLAWARFVRPDAVLVLLALCISCVYSIVQRREPLRSSAAKAVMVGLCAMLVSYFILPVGINGLLLDAGIKSPNEGNAHVVINKLVIGTDPETDGGWSSTYGDKIQQKMAAESMSYDEAGVAIVAERIVQPEQICSLVLGKSARLWWEDANSFALHDAPQNIRTLAFASDKTFVLLLLIGLSLSGVAFLRAKRLGFSDEADNLRMLLLIIALTMAAYLFIEVQARYMYFGYIILFIIGSNALEGMLLEINKRDGSRLLSRLLERYGSRRIQS